VTFEEYVKLPALNWSLLKHMAVSPKHFKHAETHPRPDTAAMALGRLVHFIALEADRVPLEFAMWPDEKDERTVVHWVDSKGKAQSGPIGGRRGTNAHKAWLEMQGDREVMTESGYRTALAIRDAVRSHPAAAELLTGGEAEVTLTWTDPETGLPCKARLDYLRPGTVVDLKTTSDISEWAFARTCAKYSYHGQHAFYTEGACRTRCMPHTFAFIAVESDPPHDVAVYELDDDSVWAGEELVRSLLLKVKQCQESGIWEGAYPSPQTLMMPPWVFPEGWDAKTGATEGWR
jgi:hypothetical protein